MPVTLDRERLSDLFVVVCQLLEDGYLANEFLNFKTLGTLCKYDKN